MQRRPVKKIIISLLIILLIAVFGFFIWLEEDDDGGHFFLSGYFEVKFYGQRIFGYVPGKLCKKEIIGFLNDFEQKASSHIEDSEVSRFNRAKTGEKVSLSHHVYELFKLSKQYYELTDGAFNYCLYDLSKLWGFMDPDGFYGVEQLPSQEEIDSLLPCADPEKIVLNDGEKTAAKLEDDVRVDFGAIAKGYALDQCRLIAQKHGIKSALFNLAGGINAVGYKDGEREEYNIGISDPRMLETGKQYFASLPVSDISVSVSGDYQRYFLSNGVRYCHIIDPFSGRPINTGDSTDEIISAVVLSQNAALADAFSTAVMVSGTENGKKLLEDNGLSGIIITSDKKYYVVGGIEPQDVNDFYERAQ